MIFKNFSYKGEHNDTYHANAFALKCMWICILVFLFCWILDIIGVFIVDLKIMTPGLAGASALCLMIFIYSMLIGIDKPSSRYVVMLAIVLMATVVCTSLSYHTTLFLIFPLVCSSQYFDKKVSAYTWILTCAGATVAVLLGYKIGLCDSNMILLTKTTSAQHIQELVSGTFVINDSKLLMFLYFVFPKWLIMLAIMPLLNHVARDIQTRTERETRSRHLAEIDGLTGLYNRTKYSQDIEAEYEGCDNLSVLFFDVNNLKLINDTRGHEYGDILIKGLANELRSLESDECTSYRIGGDEFITIVKNCSENDAGLLMRQLHEKLENKILEDGVRLSVAIGKASGKGRDIEAVVKEADEHMYLEKQSMKAGLQL